MSKAILGRKHFFSLQIVHLIVAVLLCICTSRSDSSSPSSAKVVAPHGPSAAEIPRIGVLILFMPPYIAHNGNKIIPYFLRRNTERPSHYSSYDWSLPQGELTKSEAEYSADVVELASKKTNYTKGQFEVYGKRLHTEIDTTGNILKSLEFYLVKLPFSNDFPPKCQDDGHVLVRSNLMNKVVMPLIEKVFVMAREKILSKMTPIIGAPLTPDCVDGSAL